MKAKIRKKRKTETRWAIAYDRGLYYDTRQTRREMIAHHCRELGKDWAYCKAKGDYAVKVSFFY